MPLCCFCWSLVCQSNNIQTISFVRLCETLKGHILFACEKTAGEVGRGRGDTCRRMLQLQLLDLDGLGRSLGRSLGSLFPFGSFLCRAWSYHCISSPLICWSYSSGNYLARRVFGEHQAKKRLALTCVRFEAVFSSIRLCLSGQPWYILEVGDIRLLQRMTEQ